MSRSLSARSAQRRCFVPRVARSTKVSSSAASVNDMQYPDNDMHLQVTACSTMTSKRAQARQSRWVTLSLCTLTVTWALWMPCPAGTQRCLARTRSYQRCEQAKVAASQCCMTCVIGHICVPITGCRQPCSLSHNCSPPMQSEVHQLWFVMLGALMQLDLLPLRMSNCWSLQSVSNPRVAQFL